MFKKIYNSFLKIDKRQRFVMAVAVIFITNLVLTHFTFTVVGLLLPIYILIVYGATYFALLEDIEHIEWLVLFILPVFLAVFLLLFYYLLPVRWLTRLPYFFILSVAMYGTLLCENIFNVGVEKSLPLYRAAFSIANFINLVAFFLLFTVLYSFRLHFVINTFIGALLAWPLFFHGIWISNPRAVLEERVYKFATILTLLLSFAMLILNFIPIKTSILAIYTVAITYILLGITQEIIHNTAFKERVREYLIVFAIMTIIMLLSVSWD